MKLGVLSLVGILVGAPLMPASLSAQEATLAGRIVDGADGSPIPLATVVLRRGETDDTLSGTLAGNDGRFLIRGLLPGRYVLAVSFLGFFPEERDVLVSDLNPSYDLGDVRLTRLAEVDELTVAVDALPTAGLDTEVFRLDEGVSEGSGSVLDALRTLPGVTVDQEGRVSLRGSDQVAVLIDGRPSSLTGFGTQRGLDNVPAANVAAVEIIYNPSASIDAAGMAGVINIIYEQERALGWSGEIGLSFGVGQFTKPRADLPTDLGSFSTNPKLAPSLALNFNTASVRTFVQAEFVSQDDLPNNEFTTRHYDDGPTLLSQVPENREQTHTIVRAGADLLLGERNTLTVSGIYDVEDHTDRAQVPFIVESTGERDRYWFWREEEETGFVNASLDWKHRFTTPGHELDINLQFTRGWEDEAYFLNEESAVRVGTDMTHLEAEENTLPLSVDYTRPLGSGRVEVGAKLQTRWLPIDYTVDRGEQSVIYEGLGDTSDWEEDLVAAYVNWVRVTPSYTLEAGLRAEQTDVAYIIPSENVYYPDSDAYDYFELFPNVKGALLVADGLRIVAAYNRRIDRPGEPELRIFPKYDDPELLKVGNPYLRPQLTHVYELGLSRSWDDGLASLTGYHRDISDAFQRIFAIDRSNATYAIVNKIYENAGNSTQTGIQLVAERRWSDAWALSASANWFVIDVEDLETTLLFPTPRPFALAGSRDDTWDLTANSRLDLPAGGDLRLGYIYYGSRSVPQGRQRARSSLDVTTTWPVLNERGEVIFTFSDVFNDFAVRTDVQGDGFTAVYENYLETQVATIAFRWRF